MGQMVLRSSRLLNRITDRIERAEWLDGPSEWASNALGRVLSPRPLSDVLAGSLVGHPLHPPLVAVPLGAWTSASCLDLLGGEESAAERLVALGALAALPTAVTGASDWLSTSGAERRVGAVHATLNTGALLLYTASWWARRAGDRGTGKWLSLAGLATISISGWLGGHLAYAMGVGVDTTSFQHLPDDWADLVPESELTVDRPMRCDVAGVAILVVRTADGIHALADRCTHRGGPLHEGDVADGCVTCPWHGSTFRLDDGELVSGPATRPQAVLEVRTHEGRVQVRRADEARSLRTNPVGS